MATEFTFCVYLTDTHSEPLSSGMGAQPPTGAKTTHDSWANSRTCQIAVSKLCLLLRNVLRSSRILATALGDRNRSLPYDVPSRRSVHRLLAANRPLGSKPVACIGSLLR